MNPDLDLDLDLASTAIIRAPRSVVWDAWTDPASLAAWWLPAPTRCRVERLDTVPGGAFVTSMSDDGIEFVPHLDACFLAVDAGRADRVHQRGRQSMAAGHARAGGDDRGDHHARPSRRHRLPGDRAAPRPGGARPSRAARLLRRVGDRHRAARRGSSSDRTVPDEAHAHAVRHARRRLPGTGFARRRPERRLHPRRLDGAPHGPDVHRPGRRLARARPTPCCSAAAPTRRSPTRGPRSPIPTTRSPNG